MIFQQARVECKPHISMQVTTSSRSQADPYHYHSVHHPYRTPTPHHYHYHQRRKPPPRIDDLTLANKCKDMIPFPDCYIVNPC